MILAVCIGKVLGHCVDNIKVANDGLDYLDSCKVIQYCGYFKYLDNKYFEVYNK